MLFFAAAKFEFPAHCQLQADWSISCSLVAIARAVHTMFYVQCLLYSSESRSIIYTFIYSYVHSHGYEDVTIQHPRTSKNTITLLNLPYILSHIQSHSPRAPPSPSPPAWCGLVLYLPINTCSLLPPCFSPAGAIHQHYLWHRLPCGRTSHRIWGRWCPLH